MKMLRILTVIALFASIAACKKDEPTKTELLTGGKWTLTALQVSPAIMVNNQPVTDVFASYPDCTKDDFQAFASDGTYTYDEGATKCDASNAQTGHGTWYFNTGETQITLNYDGDEETWDIPSISDKSMTTVFKLTQNGVTYTFTGTLHRD